MTSFRPTRAYPVDYESTHADSRVVVPYTITGNTLPMTGTECYSVGAWIKLSAVGGNMKRCTLMDFGTKEYMNLSGNWALTCDTEGALSLSGKTLGNYDVDNFTLTFDKWTYFLYVIDNANMSATLYVDGVNVSTHALSEKLYYTKADGEFHFMGFATVGAIDEVHLFSAALTADEATKAYESALQISSLKGFYTFNTASGTGTFANLATDGAEINAKYSTLTGLKYWYGGLHYAEDEEAATPSYVEGRDDASSATDFVVTIVQPTAHGTISVATADGTVLSSGDEVELGTGLVVTTNPDEGYTLRAVIVNGEEIAGTTFTVKEAVTVTADFEEGTPDYCYAEGTASNANRYVTSLTVADSEGNSATVSGFSGSSGRAIYYDRTSTTVTAKAGAIVTLTAAGNCNWMHQYLYVDFGRDGVFDVDQSNEAVNGDLVSHTGYTLTLKADGSDTADPSVWSDGTTIDYTQVVGVMPSFTLPSNMVTGNYRMRYKLDWNSTDPCGRSADHLYGGQKANYIAGSNSGAMIDFMLHVDGVSAIDDIIDNSNVNAPIEYYNLQGVRVAAENLSTGIYIKRQGAKADKVFVRK